MITVYLDSLDYSTLSPANINPSLRQIRDRLLAWAESGEVRFLFSNYIVSEAAPTEKNAIDFAIARGDLLSALCGQNALLEGGLLFMEEARKLSTGDDQPIDALSPTGDYFPDIEFPDPPSLEELVLDVIPDRARRRQVLKDGVVRPKFREAIHKMISDAYVNTVTARYPMKPEHADTFGRFALGKASRADATAALRASVRDPRWLMRWFAASPELAEPIIDIVRKPGREIGAMARGLIQSRMQFISNPETRDIKDAPWNNVTELKRDWEAWTASLVEDLARRTCVRIDSPWREGTAQADIAKYCPGLNTVVRSLMDAIWDSYGGGRKTLPSDSQFPDSMHSLYAPYVDIFRADRFTAPHVRRQLQGSSTTVVRLLADLPAAIEGKLAEKQAA